MHQFNPEYQIQTKAPVNFLTGAFFLFKHTDKSLAYFGVKSCAGCLDIRGDRPSAANVLTLHTAKTGVQTLYHEYTLSTKFLVNHFCSESKRENCCGGSSLCSCTSMRCFRKRSGSKVGAGGFCLPEAQARHMPMFVLYSSYFRILSARITLPHLIHFAIL